MRFEEAVPFRTGFDFSCEYTRTSVHNSLAVLLVVHDSVHLAILHRNSVV
jgi:hypothetical protein